MGNINNMNRDMNHEEQEAWDALDFLAETTVSDAFEAKLMAKIENIEATAHTKKAKPHWLDVLDGIFNVLHVPALAVLIALLFWLPITSQSQTVKHLVFPEIKAEQSLKDQKNIAIQPEKILNLLIHISRS